MFSIGSMFLMMLFWDSVEEDAFMKPSEGAVGDPVETGAVFLLWIITAPIIMTNKANEPTAIPTIIPVDSFTELTVHFLEHESRSSVLPSSHFSSPAWIPSPHTVSHTKEV